MVHPQSAAAVPKALAAYRLGLLSHTYPLWRDHSFDLPEFQHGTPDCDVFPFERFRRVGVALAGEIGVNVYAELTSGLRARARKQTSNSYPSRNLQTWGWSSTERSQPWPDLALLADQALNHASPLSSWFMLGAAIGDCRVQLHCRDASEVLLSLKSIIARVRGVSEQEGDRCPALRRIVGLVGELDGSKPKELLVRVLEQIGGPDPAEASRIDLDVFIETFLGLLDSAVEEDLAALWDQQNGTCQPIDASTPWGSVPRQEKPVWDKDRGQLRVGGVVVRKVSGKATNVIRVLDAFAKACWPHSIPDPQPRLGHQSIEPGQRADTIRSLNEGLEQIRFRGDGSGQRIQWDWA